MRREIIFAPLARIEFEDAAAWYESQQPGLSDEFRTEVGEILDRVLGFPEMFRLASPTFHKATLRRFPYSIYYSVEPKAINIVSVFHGARNPEEIQVRLK